MIGARRPRAHARRCTRGRTRGRSSTTPRNRLLARVDAEGRRTEFDRDGARPRDAGAQPEGRELGFGYDAGGNRDAVDMPGRRRAPLAFDARRPPASASRPPARRASLALDRDAGRRARDGDAPERPHDRLRPRRGRAADRPGLRRPRGELRLRRATPRGRRAIDWSPPGGRDRPAARLHLGRRTCRRASPPPASRRPLRLRLRRRPAAVAASKLTSGADEHTTALTRDADGLVTGLGPYTLTRSGPAPSVSAIGDGTLAMTIGRDAHGELALARADRRRRRRSTTSSSRATTAGASRARSRPSAASRRRSTTSTTTTAGCCASTATARPPRRTPTTPTATGRRGAAASGRAVALGYDGQDRLDTRGGADVYDFGADGFLARRGTDTLHLQRARRAAARRRPAAATVTYGYDGLGRRVSRHQGAATTEYLYGNPGDAFQVTAVRAPVGRAERVPLRRGRAAVRDGARRRPLRDRHRPGRHAARRDRRDRHGRQGARRTTASASRCRTPRPGSSSRSASPAA